jgi:hypothetical protein
LVLASEDGSEFHFGCGVWTVNGTFLHVASYATEGRAPYAWWSDVLDSLAQGWEARDEPELGPQLSPLAQVALTGLARLCNQVNGFSGEPEKKWAVEQLRALWEVAEDRFDADEVAVWAATHGWALKQAKKLREIADGVRHGTQFRGTGGHAIQRDRARERKMVAHWWEQSATGGSKGRIAS